MATFIIAEAGVNHNGDISLAKSLVEAAAETGADAVKFQSFCANNLAVKNAPKAKYQIDLQKDEDQRDMLENLELTPDEHLEISNHCKKNGIDFLSTAFDAQQLNMLIKLKMSAIKVASGEITHWPLLKSIAIKSKLENIPVFLSTGMSTLGEIEEAIQIFLDEGINRKKITLMHCLSAYPAPPEELNLRSITTLKNAFGCNVGYSDHTLGIIAPIIAVTLGASVIEKHLTLDRKLPGPDHTSSLEKEEFSELVRQIRNCESMLGDGIKRPQESEKDTLSVARRSLRVSRDLKKGDIFNEDNLVCKRPANGMSAMKYPNFLGKIAQRDYEEGECVD
tara:strand:- start:4285 stop:5292 length:1008 start_codon:yes stop_codon:yes gene_type:complete